MRAADTMIVWTPNRDGWADRPTGGKIEVTTIPEPPAFREHPMSVGACDHDWRETDDAGRLALMQRYFSQMIHRDGLDEQTVRSALSQVDEFRDYPFSSDQIPDEDD